MQGSALALGHFSSMSRLVLTHSRDQPAALSASLSGGVEDPLSEQVQLGASILRNTRNQFVLRWQRRTRRYLAGEAIDFASATQLGDRQSTTRTGMSPSGWQRVATAWALRGQAYPTVGAKLPMEFGCLLAFSTLLDKLMECLVPL